jgi:hypothetical protein
MKHKVVEFTLAAILATALLAPANATAFDMSTFHNARSVDTSGLNLWVDVIDRGSHVDFEFHNDSSIYSSITHFYFEDTVIGSGSLGNAQIIDQSSGADMRGDTIGSPHSAIGDWDGTQFRARSRWGAESMAVQQGEFLTVRFQYRGSDYQSLLGSMFEEHFDIAQKVEGVHGETVWTSQRTGGGADPVPLPASVWLLGSGFMTWFGGGAVRRRMKRG